MATCEETITRTVKVHLTELERLEMASAVGQATQEVSAAKNRKSEITKQLTAEVERHQTEVFRLVTLLANGYEYRDVECRKLLDYGSGRVQVIRMDTGEVLEERPMLPGERQMEFPAAPDGAPSGEKTDAELIAAAREILAGLDDPPKNLVVQLLRKLNLSYGRASALASAIVEGDEDEAPAAPARGRRGRA